MKPKIGIMCQYTSTIPEGNIDQNWNYLGGDYVYACEQAGATPVLLPIYHNFESLRTMVTSLDGFLLSGGNDINPSLYQQRVKQQSQNITPLQDNRELALVSMILEEIPKPLLGIGRGAQLINVARGGTLQQDVTSDGKYEHHDCRQVPSHLPSHTVTVRAQSKLAKIFGTHQIEVNSFHHQCIDQTGRQIEVTAQSTDGVTEAIEVMDHPFAFGIQWHPETMTGNPIQQKLFRAFVEACIS